MQAEKKALRRWLKEIHFHLEPLLFGSGYFRVDLEKNKKTAFELNCKYINIAEMGKIRPGGPHMARQTI